MGIKIISTGTFFPEESRQVKSVDNNAAANLDKLFTGGGKYHVANAKESAVYMGTQAAKAAINNANIDPDSIDMAICYTFVSDYEAPSDTCAILKNIGCNNATAWFVDTACASFATHLNLANMLSTTGKKRILIIESINWVNRAFGNEQLIEAAGDGAAALIVDAVAGEGSVIGALEKTSPKELEFITMKNVAATGKSEALVFSKSHHIIMKSIKIVAETASELLESKNLTADDVKWTLCHQPGVPAIKGWHKYANIPIEKNLNTYSLYGNMSATNIPATLHYFTTVEPKIQRGDLILMFTAGAGVHPASVLVRY